MVNDLISYCFEGALRMIVCVQTSSKKCICRLHQLWTRWAYGTAQRPSSVSPSSVTFFL